MDDIDRELIQLLCTKIGMLMEDHSAVALTVGGQSDDVQMAVVAELNSASKKIASLATAAQSIME